MGENNAIQMNPEDIGEMVGVLGVEEMSSVGGETLIDLSGAMTGETLSALSGDAVSPCWIRWG
ncbi:MAG: hypothetical protein CM1200mP22_06050 [Dehalococcoidia bacterium]|nr:MAG: hypothetical protein CM1200mP22_06050 [Dehalococcoidia bacterium]